MKRTLLPLLLAWILTACIARAAPIVNQSPESATWAVPASTATLAELLLPPGTPTVLPPASPTEPASPTLTPQPAATFTPMPCLFAGGEMRTHLYLKTSLLPNDLEYRVYLPPCYQQQPDRHYPVLYLIHGQSFTDDQWDRLGADETADTLIAAGEIAPFIIVMPRDLTWEQPNNDSFGQALVERLVPEIDTTYRTLPLRQFRAIGGLSRGASWAVHLGLTHWELFGAIGAHSLPVFWQDVWPLHQWLDAIPNADMPRIWIDIAEHDADDSMKSAVWFENLLTKKGISHEWYMFPGTHSEEYWSKHLELYLRWYAQDW